MINEELQDRIDELEKENKKLQKLNTLTDRVGKMAFLTAKVFQENDANIVEVYLTVGLLLGQAHSKMDVKDNPFKVIPV